LDAGVLDAARIPGAGTAITLVAVVALLSALNAAASPPN
jgi:AAT family amino acid transporter